jgi:[citrate (pro-3S)-lyase] ligase
MFDYWVASQITWRTRAPSREKVANIFISFMMVGKDTEYFDRLKLLNKIPKVNEIILSDDCFFDFCHTNPKGQMLIAKHIKELIDNEIFTVIPLYNSPTYYTIEELFTRSLLSTWKKQANVMDRINRYSAYLKSFNTNGTAGLLMVTCNPVTNGHLYIIEKLSSQLDVLYIHIGDGDFYFPFDVRYRMLNDSIKHLSNVILLKPSNKLLSNKIIWHNYLYKEELNDIADVRKLINFDSYAEFMFNLLVDNLKITHLCWGNEDKDKVTDYYNQDMQKYSYGIVVLKCQQ